MHRAFDPEQPAVLATWRADRPRSPAGKMIRELQVPFADSRFLLTGTVGTGKTTELHRIKEVREKDELVIFLDLVHHFSSVVHDEEALQSVSAWEVCFLAGVALIAECKGRYNFEFPREHLRSLSEAWTRLARSTETPEPTELDPAHLITKAVEVFMKASGVGPAVELAVTATEAVTHATRWRIPLGQAKRTPLDQEKEVQTLLAVVNTLVGLARQHLRRVLFIVDGLDRMRSLERAKRLLIESRMIGELDCPLVVCAPLCCVTTSPSAASDVSSPKCSPTSPC